MTFSNDNSGILTKPSSYTVAETLDRLEGIVQARGMTIFARIDQQLQAQSVGLSLRPTQLLLFGDPKTGTPLMQNYPSAALDLPLKAVAWEAEDGQVWLSYNSPEFLQQRHGLPPTAFAGIGTLIDQAL